MNTSNSKQKLLTACKKVLLEEGHSALTIRKIAKVAGVNQGLVHHYFNTKENMVSQLLDQESAQITDNVKEYIKQTNCKKLPIKFLSETDFGTLLIEIVLLSQRMSGLKAKVQEIIADRRNLFGSLFGIESQNDRILLQICVLGSVILSRVDSKIKTPEVLENLQDKILSLTTKQTF